MSIHGIIRESVHDHVWIHEIRTYPSLSLPEIWRIRRNITRSDDIIVISCLFRQPYWTTTVAQTSKYHATPPFL